MLQKACGYCFPHFLKGKLRHGKGFVFSELPERVSVLLSYLVAV